MTPIVTPLWTPHPIYSTNSNNTACSVSWFCYFLCPRFHCGNLLDVRVFHTNKPKQFSIEIISNYIQEVCAISTREAIGSMLNEFVRLSREHLLALNILFIAQFIIQSWECGQALVKISRSSLFSFSIVCNKISLDKDPFGLQGCQSALIQCIVTLQRIYVSRENSDYQSTLLALWV